MIRAKHNVGKEKMDEKDEKYGMEANGRTCSIDDVDRSKMETKTVGMKDGIIST